MLFEAGEEFGFGHGKSVGSRAREESGNFGVVFDAAELPNVIEDECPVVEFENSAGVFAAVGVPEKFAGHAKVHIEDAAIKVGENLFTATGDTFNGGAGESLGGGLERCTGDAMGEHFRVEDGVSGNVGRNGTDDSFDFWEFGHGVSSSLRRLCHLAR